MSCGGDGGHERNSLSFKRSNDYSQRSNEDDVLGEGKDGCGIGWRDGGAWGRRRDCSAEGAGRPVFVRHGGLRRGRLAHVRGKSAEDELGAGYSKEQDSNPGKTQAGMVQIPRTLHQSECADYSR